MEVPCLVLGLVVGFLIGNSEKIKLIKMRAFYDKRWKEYVDTQSVEDRRSQIRMVK